MKLILALAALAVACFASSCSSTDDGDIPRPAESQVWRISPAAP